MDTRPIGMFDSGVGGLTVLKEVIKQSPQEEIIYLGDTKRFPYGSKSKDTIIELTKKGIDFLINKNVKAVIIACGTATSQALEALQPLYTIPLIGIIEATVQYIKEKTAIQTVGVIATAGTIRSQGWQQHLEKQVPRLTIQNQACPLLAPMAEEGWIDNEIAKLTVHEYIKDFKNIDALILGCTHYPLFKPLLEQELGKQVEIIHTGEIVSKALQKFLVDNHLENTGKGGKTIFLTDTQTNFVKVASIVLETAEKDCFIQKADIEA